MRRSLAWLVGLLVAVGVLILRHGGQLHGAPALVLAAIGILAVPTSTMLARRILLAGLILIGFVPLLWLWRVPTGGIGRAGVVLALLYGGVIAWTRFEPARVRLLLPRLKVVDAYPFLAGGSTLVMFHHWLTIRGGPQALSVLASGWDNAAHFDMYQMMRINGVSIDALGPSPDGSVWNYSGYPQAYHSVAATVAELIYGPVTHAGAAELVHYLRADLLVLAATITMVVAGVCALPRARRYQVGTFAAAVLVTSTFLVGQGMRFFLFGQPNFVLALGVAAALVPLCVTMVRPLDPLPMLALGGGFAAMASGWLFMIILAPPMLATVVFPLRRRRWNLTTTNYVLAVLILAYVALASVKALQGALDLTRAVTNFVSLAGAAPESPLWRALLVGGLALGLAWYGVPLRRGAPVWSLPRSRNVMIAGVAVVGYAGAAVVAAIQFAQVGHVSYYYVKWLAGVEIVTFVVLATVLVDRFGRSARKRSRATRAGAAVAVSVGLLEMYGYLGPLAWAPGDYTRWSPLMQTSVYSARVDAKPFPFASHLIAAIPVQERLAPALVYYVAMGPWDTTSPENMEEWYRSLTATWTLRNFQAAALPAGAVVDVSTPLAILQQVASLQGGGYIVVVPEALDQVRASIADPNLKQRVVSW